MSHRHSMMSAAAAAAAAAAGLIRRHPRCSWLSRGGRSLATQTATTTESPSALAQSMPWLLVTSSSDLQSHYLYTLTKNSSSRPASIHLKLDRELNVPEIASNSIIGSSQGYLISIPAPSDGVTLNIHAINPITGALLHIPATSDRMARLELRKVVLSPSLDMAALVTGQDYPSHVGFARLRSSSTFSSWKFVKFPDGIYGDAQDCIFHNDGLYVTNKYASVTVFHVGGPSIWKDIHKQENAWREKSILVESPEGDDLYLIVRERSLKDGRCRYHFKVFKLDEDDNQWKNVESIGDLAVFVARNGAMSLHTRHSPLLKPNCIYFFGDDYCYDPDKEARGIYSLKSDRFKPFGANDDDHILTLTRLPPVFFQPKA